MRSGSPDGVQQQCSWCRQPVSKQVTLDSPSGVKVFCSEVCFDQCRRASFKKSKTCDWCKHARHTVNYVEFKDGSTELQFCGDKCLNQYKMSVFCKETQELSKKISKPETQNSYKEDKSRRDEILITPELWFGGDRPRLHQSSTSSRRLSLPESEFNENRRERGSRRVHNHIAEESLDLSKKAESRSESVDSSRLPLIDKIKQESSSEHKRTSSNKTDKRSPTRSERSAPSPAVVSNMTQLSAHALHPAVAGLAPWLPPGLLPYMHMAPVMMPGIVPAPTVEQLRPATTDDSDSDRIIPKRDQGLNHRIENAVPSTSQLHDNRAHVSLPDRRTSSLFPVDFPHFLQHGGIPGPAFPHAMPDIGAQRLPSFPGIPPVTVMMPFPVVLPLPVPIPIPIPLTLSQLTNLFGEKSESSNSSQKTNSVSKDPETTTDSKSPHPPYSQSPHSVVSTASDGAVYDKQPDRTGSRSSLPNMVLYTSNDIRNSRNDFYSLKRSRTPESLDLSKTSKIPRYEVQTFSTHSNDGVIDLSSTRDNGHKSEDNCSESGLLNGSVSDETSTSLDHDTEGASEGHSLPKIHIITHKDDTPLNVPLPLPPTENPYSSRRGLILDAPTVTKKSRSPSPERRVYVRNVPRDIIEAARRRSSIRSRIRTK